MTLTLELPEDLEARLTAEAARLGLPVNDYALQLLRSCPPADARATFAVESSSAGGASGVEEARVRSAPTARELLAMPAEERRRVLVAQAIDAEGLYRADLERPIRARELTALTILDSEPFDDAL